MFLLLKINFIIFLLKINVFPSALIWSLVLTVFETALFLFFQEFVEVFCPFPGLQQKLDCFSRFFFPSSFLSKKCFANWVCLRQFGTSVYFESWLKTHEKWFSFLNKHFVKHAFVSFLKVWIVNYSFMKNLKLLI